MRLQRLIQILFFALFLALILLASYQAPEFLESDALLRLDPLLSLGSMAAARAFIPKAAVAGLVLIVALFLGRIFCGYICPLGACIDFSDSILSKKRENSFEKTRAFRHYKYLILAGLAGSAVFGISWIAFFSPLSLSVRFFGLVIHPVFLFLEGSVLEVLRPLFAAAGLDHIALASVQAPRFNTNFFTASFFLAILALGLIAPRFWCRNLCPAGALIALFSPRPLFRRRVSDACTGCGRCVRNCPTGAISKDFKGVAQMECITCLKCENICPEKAVSFRIARGVRARAPIDITRRKVIKAGAAGMATAAITLTGLRHIHGEEEPRPLKPSNLIRPPGALPETDFQARCVRCALCAKACPTNTLQPLWFEAGVSGLLSPAVTPRLGGCEQACNLCGRVCPTGAIRPLSFNEKLFAKIGTARIIKSRCIAWEQARKCLICDEICPYNAISSRFLEDHPVTVPFVDEKRCNGCGYCENKCLVTGEAAIVVEATGELRLSKGSYRREARRLGLVFNAKQAGEDHAFDGSGTLPPGFEPHR
ncbi:MAG: 4Fe-4S ferredoxin [Deltaproteobacteria bacterium CG_4_8_14_3_um_filter_51_11]|nr:4Fe-4S binding protein [bacterium]OIP43782.1 MAG: hypothetical protein AUK25_00585 [Desulfobacteraceae bacterium CG2_30_51_40]PIP46816.1 MAG: 4Fe-4S ferredoxin [Deltaproteobacteria bacterium CG23_combo_of_CG06-09_8_20_14_all_51_20]PIX20408.1 MAG: 4Fe-4S ferredoxin [Deltaproteobacteria bacterium CG_4_8_14_3_um_filter_51_11]PIY24756.1 MAG: 4Fe-4S ferredoxin [Deltaproteobacteria bacterium CG_4_10_14_3_um_filter_51_14]PJB35209.1 MAG: 4Fe-4S ferredoxin [Deltaproteobacteria bacterium CG_4_9_14_3_